MWLLNARRLADKYLPSLSEEHGQSWEGRALRGKGLANSYLPFPFVIG